MNHEEEMTADDLIRYQEEMGERCYVHGGTEWKGGYCNRWPYDTGKGPCIAGIPLDKQKD